MVAPKGPISNETWKRISRGLDKIEGICKQASTNLGMCDGENYKEIDLYNEIVTWRAVL